MNKVQEGFINVTGGKVYYKIVGDKGKDPLIALHGGPGYPHDSLEPLEDLANERQIIFYDQLGCGNSQKNQDKSLWTIEHFVEELGEIIKALDLKHYHLLGHSWGAGLGVSYALTKPKGLKSLILTDSYISTPHWEKDAERLLHELPEPMYKALKKAQTNTDEYKEASNEFYFRHVYRFHDIPVGCLKAQNKMNYELYNYMWGPEEFLATGTLKNFDLSGRLHEIELPVLLLCGRFDEATPETTELFKNLLPNSTMTVFEKSAHVPQWKERKAYIKTVRDFINKN